MCTIFIPRHTLVSGYYVIHSYIENIVLSATKILGIMRKLKYSITRNALNQMYMSHIRGSQPTSVLCVTFTGHI